VIKTAYTATPRCFGTPASRRVRTAWTGALVTKGVVCAQPMAIDGLELPSTGVRNHGAVDGNVFPGTSVWSPPT
jgi:hypothetical protein